MPSRAPGSEGDAMTEGDDRNNSPVFTDDEACAAYDALYVHLRQLSAERREYLTFPDPQVPGGLLRAIAAAEGAMDKLGHDR